MELRGVTAATEDGVLRERSVSVILSVLQTLHHTSAWEKGVSHLFTDGDIERITLTVSGNLFRK